MLAILDDIQEYLQTFTKGKHIAICSPDTFKPLRALLDATDFGSSIQLTSSTFCRDDELIVWGKAQPIVFSREELRNAVGN